VRDFLHFVYTNDPKEDDFSVRLTQRVEMLKQNEHFREVYAAMDLREMDIRREALAEGMQQGLSKGKIQGAIDSAVIAVREFNIAPQLAAQKMNVPLDKVMEKLGRPYNSPQANCQPV
jgi:predicted transposase YdaD